jgi:hypothetical protein
MPKSRPARAYSLPMRVCVISSCEALITKTFAAALTCANPCRLTEGSTTQGMEQPSCGDYGDRVSFCRPPRQEHAMAVSRIRVCCLCLIGTLGVCLCQHSFHFCFHESALGLREYLHRATPYHFKHRDLRLAN